MSTIHDQAMNYVYQQVLQRLLSFFSRAERTALQLLIQRLAVAAGGMDRIGSFKVLVVQSGTRDSCYALALMRAAQLSIAGRAPATFQLRVATLRRTGIGAPAMHNIHRSYSALFLYDDPRVELLMVDHREVLPFDEQAPLSDDGREANRVNQLLMGHRRAWNEGLELWDDVYLSTAEFYGQVARWNNGVDALVASEPLQRQRHFLDGLNRAVQKAGIGTLPPSAASFDDLFPVLDGLGGDVYRQFYTDGELMPWRPAGQFEACRRTSFIDIHDMVVGKLEERWPLLTDFLGFHAEEMALHLGENEYIDPLLTAHLRGLQASLIEGRAYEDGVSQYLQSCLATLHRKQVPETLCERLQDTLGQLRDHEESRGQMAQCLQQTFGLSEAQMVCLMFAPFVDNGAGLERFLRHCHPGMLVAMPDLHRAMQGLHAPEQVLHWMTDVSGLPVKLIGRLYAMTPPSISAPALESELGETDAVADDCSAEG
ncbi:hypothetical protein N8H74_06250 [Pseudomonas sp. B2M1-30]|uniref:hypothetical protein n=1 Tax=Pseudomonas TaxID=286 RepID=UPI0021C9FC0C|nr:MULTISPECIES: hypothetical protein [Pseudomonas]MCU0117845.1 hypothetical protein [Pseudomonas sp. B2M1-30]MCU7259381.1 hypothetical protein [Pseudomonas koreensis]